jgi:hypothetical protein
MQEKSLKNSLLLRQQELKANTKYHRPVVRNGWVIQFSVYKETDILLFMTSRYTGQTIVRFFKDEDEAVNFINMVINRDYKIVQEL